MCRVHLRTVSIALLWHINAKAKGPPASSNTTSSPIKPQQMTLSHTPESPGPFTNLKKAHQGLSFRVHVKFATPAQNTV